MSCTRTEDCILHTKTVNWDYRTRAIEHGLQKLYRPQRPCRMWSRSFMRNNQPSRFLKPRQLSHHLTKNLVHDNALHASSWLANTKPLTVDWMAENYDSLARTTNSTTLKAMKNFTASELIVSYLADVPPVCLGCLKKNQIVEYCDYLLYKHSKLRQPKTSNTHLSLGLSNKNRADNVALKRSTITSKTSRLDSQKSRESSIKHAYQRLSHATQNSRLSNISGQAQTSASLNNLLAAIRTRNGTGTDEKTVGIGQAAEQIAKLMYELVLSGQDRSPGITAVHALACEAVRPPQSSTEADAGEDTLVSCRTLLAKHIKSRGEGPMRRANSVGMLPSHRSDGMKKVYRRQSFGRAGIEARIDKLSLVSLVYGLAKQKTELRHYFDSTPPSSRRHAQVIPPSPLYDDHKKSIKAISSLEELCLNDDLTTSESHNFCKHVQTIARDLPNYRTKGNKVVSSKEKIKEYLGKKESEKRNGSRGVVANGEQLNHNIASSTRGEATRLLCDSTGTLQMEIYLPRTNCQGNDEAADLGSTSGGTKSTTPPYTPIWEVDNMLSDEEDEDDTSSFCWASGWQGKGKPLVQPYSTPDSSAHSLPKSERGPGRKTGLVSYLLRKQWKRLPEREVMDCAHTCGIWRIPTPVRR